MRRYFYETLHPEIYHGYGKKPPFFEGWYFKLVSKDAAHRYAVIPGIFRASGGHNDHAFIQILDGMTGEASYHEYPLDAFWADREHFDVRIGPNQFSRERISLNIDDDKRKVQGTIQLGNGIGWPVRLLEPGVMGWYGWLPFMECYHGVLSFDHELQGTLTVDGTQADLSAGRGYLEKDWGQAFPSAYVWMQSNHFNSEGSSLSASIAIVPSVGRRFAGFLAGFYHQGTLHRMATYTNAKVEKLVIEDQFVYLTLTDREHRLEMTAERSSGGLLLAPIRTEMHKRVDETMQSKIFVRFSSHDGAILFEGTGHNAALEVHGDLETLLRMAGK